MSTYYPPEAGGMPAAPPPSSTSNLPIAGRLVRGSDIPSFNGKQVSLLGTLQNLQGSTASVRSVDGIDVCCTLACPPTAALQSVVIICGEAQGNSLINCFRVIPLGGDLDNETADKVFSFMHNPALADLYTPASMPPPQ